MKRHNPKRLDRAKASYVLRRRELRVWNEAGKVVLALSDGSRELDRAEATALVNELRAAIRRLDAQLGLFPTAPKHPAAAPSDPRQVDAFAGWAPTPPAANAPENGS